MALPAASNGGHLDLLDKWDDPGLLSVHLQHTKEPSLERPLDVVVLKARAQILKARIRSLQHTHDALAPRHNVTVDTELAGSRFKRKILLWLTFPINDLPPEILATIFHMVLNASESPQQAVLHRLRMTWVCNYWRHVAINDKLFWNVIWFRDSPPFARSLTWVDRAGTAPLDIRIDERQREEEETEDPKLTREEVSELMDALLAKVGTIRTMVIVLGTWAGSLAAMEKFSHAGEPSSLERFELHRSGLHSYSGLAVHPVVPQDPDESHDPIVLCGGVAPRLRWLVINGISLDWYRSPLSDLTTLDLRRIEMSDCPPLPRWLEILEGCPRLYRLSLDAAGPKWLASDVPSPRPPVELPYLREVFVGDCSLAYASFIFKYLSAPGLVCLTMMNMFSECFGPLFEALIGQFPLVRILALYHIAMYATDYNISRVTRLLESMPHIEYLKVSKVPPLVLNAFLEDPRNHRRASVLSEDPQPSEEDPVVVCPDLHVLTVHEQDKSIVRFTSGRKSLGSPIRKTYFSPINLILTTQEFEDLRSSVIDIEPLTELIVLTPEEQVIHKEMLVSAELENDELYGDAW
ncbi:hypothetical protein EUX98_g744 [Antrodiella citrinella]|uniref:Uncharacterized protein n=1 Tax=Antrodiella citrinella TaxID=2447956 RepID=A0A4S4N391_9APHY|nr:hypothetical protein EUX98_g744 [Antrodiella citrinella]